MYHATNTVSLHFLHALPTHATSHPHALSAVLCLQQPSFILCLHHTSLITSTHPGAALAELQRTGRIRHAFYEQLVALGTITDEQQRNAITVCV